MVIRSSDQLVAHDVVLDPVGLSECLGRGNVVVDAAHLQVGLHQDVVQHHDGTPVADALLHDLGRDVLGEHI